MGLPVELHNGAAQVHKCYFQLDSSNIKRVVCQTYILIIVISNYH